jgi:hypothetical protein
MLAVSSYPRIVHDDGLLAADKQIKLSPDTSVLGHDVGDRIARDEPAFSRLATAFLDEILRRYP